MEIDCMLCGRVFDGVKFYFYPSLFPDLSGEKVRSNYR